MTPADNMLRSIQLLQETRRTLLIAKFTRLSWAIARESRKLKI